MSTKLHTNDYITNDMVGKNTDISSCISYIVFNTVTEGVTSEKANHRLEMMFFMAEGSCNKSLCQRNQSKNLRYSSDILTHSHTFLTWQNYCS